MLPGDLLLALFNLLLSLIFCLQSLQGRSPFASHFFNIGIFLPLVAKKKFVQKLVMWQEKEQISLSSYGLSFALDVNVGCLPVGDSENMDAAVGSRIRSAHGTCIWSIQLWCKMEQSLPLAVDADL